MHLAQCISNLGRATKPVKLLQNIFANGKAHATEQEGLFRLHKYFSTLERDKKFATCLIATYLSDSVAISEKPARQN